MYIYEVRTINLRDSDRSLTDHLNRLARDGWDIVCVYERNAQAGKVRLFLRRVQNPVPTA